MVSEQHRANREVALAGWLLARLPEIIFTLEELEDELWRHVVELMPFAGVSDILAQIAADRIPVAAISNERGIDAKDHERRVQDLTKALIASREHEPRLVGPLKADYGHLARAIASRLVRR